jgi:hypothetical protein
MGASFVRSYIAEYGEEPEASLERRTRLILELQDHANLANRAMGLST